MLYTTVAYISYICYLFKNNYINIMYHYKCDLYYSLCYVCIYTSHILLKICATMQRIVYFNGCIHLYIGRMLLKQVSPDCCLVTPL